ncbi:hypothetical protein BGI51_11050 [Pseudomonas oryzihabitans]|nr:hypothetical protein BGI51_11050 [Pseudomonas psychrotolerans]
MFADVERQATGEHQQHRHQGHPGAGQQGGADAGGHVVADLGEGGVHVVQVEAGAQHPAPALQLGHVGELFRHLPAGGLLPAIALEAIALPGAPEQRLDHQQAGTVGQLPEIPADQFGLAWMHEIAAMLVVDEEIAVAAEVQTGQQRQYLGLGVLVVATAAVQRLDGADAHLHIVAQLGLLAAEDAVFEQPGLLLAQALALFQYHQADRGHRQQQGQQSEGNHLVFELHRHLSGLPST